MQPEPEFALFVRVEGEVVGLGAVAFEEAGEGLAGVHDAEKAGVVDQLFVAVWTGCGGGNKFVFDGGEEGQKFLIGLAAVAAQYAGFVERYGGEDGRVEFAVADGFVVGEVEVLAGFHFGGGADEFEADAEAGAQLHDGQAAPVLGALGGDPRPVRSVERSVAPEFLPHAEGQDDEHVAAGMLLDEAQALDLHDRFAEAEGGENGAVSAGYSPLHDVALVGLEQGVDVVQGDVEAVAGGKLDLAAQEVEVVGVVGHGSTLPVQAFAGSLR